MKKLFESLGVITLICLSFLYTEKTVEVVKEYDEIMIEIKKQNKNFKVNAIDAIIDNNTIIPGLKGKKINEDKSYSKMKRYGKFNSNLLEYEDILPTISIKNNLDKYVISGNSNKKMVSLVFLVDSESDINSIIKVLNNKKIKANFFIDATWLEKNEKLLLELIRSGHNVGNLNIENTTGNYAWTDNMIKKISNKNNGYCYSEKENEKLLKICSNTNNYTIKPTIISGNYPLKKIKENIKAGSIISLKINSTTIKELSLIINYINSKGYEISNLNDLLEE